MTPNEIEALWLALDVGTSSLLLLAAVVGPWLIAARRLLKLDSKGLRHHAE